MSEYQWFGGDDRGKRTKMFKLQLAVLGVVLLVVFAGTRLSRNARVRLAEYRCDAGGYCILFPRNPVECSQEIETDAGLLRMFCVRKETPRGAYVAYYVDYPEDYVDAVGGDVLVKEAIEQIDTVKGGRVVDFVSVPVQGGYGAQARIELGKMVMRTRVVMVGSRQWRVTVLSSDENINGGRVGRILESLKVSGESAGSSSR